MSLFPDVMEKKIKMTANHTTGNRICDRFSLPFREKGIDCHARYKEAPGHKVEREIDEEIVKGRLCANELANRPTFCLKRI